MNQELESRVEELSREFSEQVKLLQAHYEGRVAEVKRLIEQAAVPKSDKEESKELPS